MNQPQNRLDEEIILPNGVGKQIKIAVSQKEKQVREQSCRSRYVFDPEEINVLGEDKTRAKNLAEGSILFIAESAYMPLIGKTLGQVLGPRGKMPIPLTLTRILFRSSTSPGTRSRSDQRIK